MFVATETDEFSILVKLPLVIIVEYCMTSASLTIT